MVAPRKAHRITVRPKVGPGRTLSYTIDAVLSKKVLDQIARKLANPIAEAYAIDRILAPKVFGYAIEIGFLPGVTDNVGATVRELIEDALGKKFKHGQAVYSSYFVFQTGAEAGGLYNPLIERATIISRKKFNATAEPVVPSVKLTVKKSVDEVDLDVSDEELVTIGKHGIADADGSRRGPLALSFDDLQNIHNHFTKLGRYPTDIELESIAQTWSEHCKHTIFNDPLDDIHEGIYRRYIRGATERIRKEKGKKDFCVSVFKDNSGGIAFDDRWIVTHKVETHNSPSALDPFGGAITGIVGVNRDALGFGLGAKPIANTYGFMIGEPTDKRVYFRDKERTRPLLSSRRILEGVVRGVNAGGNQSGIPTPLGFIATDPRYRGKPLVFVGTVGLIPRKHSGRMLSKKRARPGDLIVMIGGRVGLDGVHGATFSSEALASGSPATAVQIGDPITQKKLSDALIREARDRNLYTSLTDNGAGGLSCSVAEMARESGGCDVNLNAVPLKYPGLSPWQIWISESQERMTLAVPKGKWKQLKKIMDKHGVEASIIGRFTKSGRCVVRSEGKIVMNLSLSFLHEGRISRRQISVKPKDVKHPGVARTPLLSVIADPNVGSYAFIADQYDHEVQGTSVTKPLHGRGRVNADAAVLKPIHNSEQGIVLSHGVGILEDGDDAYHMAATAIDLAIRNAIAAGGVLDHLALLDNFCWSSGNSPERLWQLKEAARACYDVAVAYGTPFISGKDSMFNDFKGYDARGRFVHIAAPPTLLISTIGVIPNVARATTLDFKSPGDTVYAFGDGKLDFKKNKKLYQALSSAIGRGLVSSAIAVDTYGPEVAIAKSAIAGQLATTAHAVAASFIVSIAPQNVKAFEKLVKAKKITTVGHTPPTELTAAYRKPFKGM